MTNTVTAYSLSGKYLGSRIVKSGTFNPEKELGISSGAYLVKITYNIKNKKQC